MGKEYSFLLLLSKLNRQNATNPFKNKADVSPSRFFSKRKVRHEEEWCGGEYDENPEYTFTEKQPTSHKHSDHWDKYLSTESVKLGFSKSSKIYQLLIDQNLVKEEISSSSEDDSRMSIEGLESAK